jgi:hypothetical protein
MPERDPFVQLRQLAGQGEDLARPLPVERVRQLGNRRRTRRRTGMIAAAVAAVVIAGGVIAGQGVLRGDRSPEPVATPTAAPTAPTTPTETPSATTASPTAGRTVTEANLITAEEVPRLDEESFAETDSGVGRPADQVTVCLPDGALNQLGATEILGRNFRRVRLTDGSTNPPTEPFGSEPTIYTQALQFDSAAHASAAYRTYRGWLDGCAATIKARKDIPLGAGVDWIAVQAKVPGAKAGFTERTWRARSDTSESGYFESVGLALVGDRLAVTVSLQYGQDYNIAYRPDGDPVTGLPPHPQFGLLVAAAHRLAG